MQDSMKETDDIIITKQNMSFVQQSEQSPKNNHQNKQRFPTITNSLLKSAIEANYIEADQKNIIIRNPNQLTVFRMHFDIESPRTQTAMEMLNIQNEDLFVQEYSDFYQQKKDPLQNLVLYLQYITNKYKSLNELLKRRNQIKHAQSQVQKQLNSKNIKYREESLDNSRINYIEEMHSSILSASKKKEQFDRKIQKESGNYNKFLNIVQDQLNKQEQYYNKTAPEIYQKVEQLRQKKLNIIKKKLQQKNQKVEKIHNKIKKDEQVQIKEHSKVVKELENDLQLHQQRKQKQLLQFQDELVEQLKKKEEREKERQFKRQIQVSQEQEQIEQMMDTIKKKTDYLNDFLNKKQVEDKKRQLENLKNMEEKQKKMQDQYQQKENENVQWYYSKSTQRQIQIFKHEQSQIKQQKSLSLKNSRIMKKYEQQCSIDQQRLDDVNNKIQEADEKLEGGLKRHKSLLDMRKQNLSQKNEYRFKLAKQKQMENMLEKIHKQNQILQKNLEINQKNEQIKQELNNLEKYKKEQLQDQVIQRSLMSQKIQIL